MSDPTITEPMVTESALHAVLTVVFAVILAAWALHEIRQFLLRYFFGEVLPPPDKSAIVNQPPDEEVSEWYLRFTP